MQKVTNFDQQVRDGKGHYYVSSASNWKCGTNLFDTINDVIKYDCRLVKSKCMAGHTLSVWFVPLHVDEKYHISDYKPDVKNCILIATHNYEKKLKGIVKRMKK